MPISVWLSLGSSLWTSLASAENRGQGLTPTFNWLEKYRRQIAGEDQETNNSNVNPFATDVFDPLKHMNMSSDANNGMQTAWVVLLIFVV